MSEGAEDEDEAREFAFTESDYRSIRQLLERRAGIHLSSSKQELAYGRMARVVRKRGLTRVGDYLDVVRSGDKEVLTEFVNALTTNVTSFFREPAHFEFLAAEYVPELVAAGRSARDVRFWSAACSTGEEPYSIAMVLKESLPKGWRAKVLATDLDSNVLEAAELGLYGEEQVAPVAPERRRRWFVPGGGEDSEELRISPELRAVVTFQQLNLIESWPLEGPFDAIFCRNVLIYFTRKTQQRLFDRFADLLRPGCCLFLGHSESMLGTADRFEFCGKNVYRKVC